MPVNSYDVSFLVALLMQGILLGVVDWYAIIWGSTKASVTFIHRAFVLYVLSIIMWTFWNIVNNFGFESLAPGTWGNYLVGKRYLRLANALCIYPPMLL